MMLYFVIFFLWLSLLIYLLMGGADFGAGILELFFSRKFKSQIRDNSYHAIGPIWEANHMWLIIALVILFVGFPDIYSTVSVFLHIPILIMLIGIIARGTSFTFRHYDAVNDRWQAVYDKIFVYSSFITPFFLGIIAGSAVARTIDTQNASFASSYIFSWLSWFSVSTGLFTVAICGFLAAIYMLGEVTDPGHQKSYRYQGNVMIVVMLLCTAFVFIAANHESIPLFNWTFGNLWSLTAVMLGAISLVILWSFLIKGSVRYLRFLAAFMVTALLIAVTYAHFPNIILLKNGHDLSLLDQDTPPRTIYVLGFALLFGSLLILPSLIYLVYSFHKKTNYIIDARKQK
jgi:cytochrome d ubiquinol oxidase subunit II